MAATTLCVAIVVWLVVGDGSIPELHWRILLVVMLVVFIVASLATTEIIPWHSRSLVEWRQPKVLGSITVLLLGAAAFIAGIANAFGPDAARQDTLAEVAAAVGAAPADAAERDAWEKRKIGSCTAIEQYIRQYPTGHYVRTATALLATRREAETGSTTVISRALPLTEPPDGVLRASVSEARSEALARGQRQAARLCGLYAQAGTKIVGIRIAADDWNCDAHACGFEGRAVCSIAGQEVRQMCGTAEAK